MILKYELENFCKDIEAKLPSLEGKQYEAAVDKIHILNRVNIEFMEYETLLRTMALQQNEMKASTMRMALELRELKNEMIHLKENIK